VIVLDLPGTYLDGRLRTTSRLEGDVVVLSPTRPDPDRSHWEDSGSFIPEEAEGPEAESGKEELSDGPMAPSTRLKYSRFRGDGRHDVDDWYCEFESIANANEEDPEAKRRIFQGLLKGEALKWYIDVPEDTRDSWAEFVPLFLKTFREAGGEARALGRLSRMTMKPAESVRKYSQRVKALIQKLTTGIAQSVQVEWYVAGFPEKMGFHIRQTRPATLREAMEAAQNYENSAQSIRKSLKKPEKGRKYHRGRRKYDSTSESSSSSTSEDSASESSSSAEEAASNSRIRNHYSGSGRERKGKELIKVKVEEDESRKLMKNIQETLAAIQVNLAENRKPRKIVPTSRANVWCARCGEAGHFPPECSRPPQKRIHYVQPEEDVYYTFPEEEEDEEELAQVYQVQSTYGRGRAPAAYGRTSMGIRTAQSGLGRGTGRQIGYTGRPFGYCFNCGSPEHFVSHCPFPRQGQGAPRILPCQNCQEYGHSAPQCPKPEQTRPIFKEVEVPPREQTGLNYGHGAGTENPEK
jgi:hypothetical protein